MEKIDLQYSYKFMYDLLFFDKVNKLVQKRKILRVTQYEMARRTEVSVRKIQMFEDHESLDAYLLYAYKEILQNNL